MSEREQQRVTSNRVVEVEMDVIKAELSQAQAKLAAVEELVNETESFSEELDIVMDNIRAALNREAS